MLLKKALLGFVLIILCLGLLIGAHVFRGNLAIANTGLASHRLETALELAGSQDKYVLADVSAVWCPNCQELDREVLAVQAVRDKINQQFIYVRLEYGSPAGKAFRSQYDVQSFPQLLILDPSGKPLKTLPTTFDTHIFLEALDL